MPRRSDEHAPALDQRARGYVDPSAELSSDRRQDRLLGVQQHLRDEIGPFTYGQVMGWLRLIHDGPAQ